MPLNHTAILVFADGERLRCGFPLLRELQHYGVVQRVRLGLYQVLPHDNEQITAYIKRRCNEQAADPEAA